MRRLIRLGAAVLLAATGLVVSQATPSGAGHCAAGETHTDPVTVSTVPVLGDVHVLGGSCTKVDPKRTLVYQGVALITNGVNFAGSGTGGAAGTYVYDGICVMVSYTSPSGSSAPTGDPTISDCQFGTTDGEYHDPDTPNPLFHGVLGPTVEASDLHPGTVDHTAAGHTGHPPSNPPGDLLAWDPAGQVSCLNSSGSGISTFTSNGVDGTPETWSANYSWTNSLDNLKGPLTGPAGTFEFDSKIQAHAYPVAADGPLDQTDAGCLQKTVNNNGSDRTGLNDILIVGTSSWDVRAPAILP